MGQFPHASVPNTYEEAGDFFDDMRLIISALQILGEGVIWRAGTGSPEGLVRAGAGSLYSRTDGPPWLYVKESTGTTMAGWVAK